jgi:hypothetical protein
MRVKGQKSIKVTEKCHNYLKAISKGSEITIGQFLEDFVTCFYEDICSQYPSGFSINYLPSVSSSYIMVQALGKGRILQSGVFKVTSPTQVAEYEQEIIDNAKIEKTTSFSQIEAQMSRIKNKTKREVK